MTEVVAALIWNNDKLMICQRSAHKARGLLWEFVGGKVDTEPLITHTYPLSKIDEAYELFENKRDGVIKVAIEC